MKRFLTITAHSMVLPGENDNWKSAVPAKMKRRDARIWQMAMAAVNPLIGATGTADRPRSVIVGTALGALEETRQFLDGVFTDGLGSPRNFISSVHNSIAGKIALEYGIGGPNLTICDSHNSLASALVTIDLLDDDDFPILLCCIDERIPLIDELLPHFSRRCTQYLSPEWKEAAVAFIIDLPDTPGRPVRAFGPFCTQRRDPEFVCRSVLQKELPTFTGRFLFNESTTSFVQPAVTAATVLDTIPTHAVIGSYSPTSGAAALVEIGPST